MKERKWFSFLSATMIGVASLGFLVTTQFYEKEIEQLKERNDGIVVKQKDAAEMFFKANEDRQYFRLLEGLLNIQRRVSSGDGRIRQMEQRVINASMSAAMNALTMALLSGKLTEEQYNTATNTLLVERSTEKHFQLYLKFTELGSQGTKELDEVRKGNVLKISALTSRKLTIWYVCFFLQSLGLAIAIVVLGTKPRKEF
ncbi:MAG: hypothetical protein ABSE41_02105 [Bacteroidota bacterium]|jgi:hypothetical protein